MTEVELKIVSDAQGCETVWKRALAAGLCAEIPPVATVESTYFDTPGRALEKAGISLRLRSRSRVWLQTVKYGRKLRSGLSRVAEVQNPVQGPTIDIDAIPDEALRRRIRDTVGREPLSPVTSTSIARRAGILTLPGGARIELAADVGEIVAGSERRPFCEIEFELLEGEASVLFDVARDVLPEGVLHFSRHSKGARGLMLAASGEIEPKPAPRKALVVPLAPDEAISEAIRQTLRECLDQISLNLVVVAQSNAPEGPHQLRVGLRRLRSMISVYGKAMDGEECRRLASEAKWLAGEVGRLRDVDAVAVDLVGPLAAADPGEPGFAALLSALADEAAKRREALRATLASARTRNFLLDLAREIETGRHDGADGQALPDYAARILRRRFERVGTAAADIAALDGEHRHELRKELKKLRYAVEFFAPLHKRARVAAFVAHLKDLQEIMGHVMDAAVGERLIDETGLRTRPDPDLQRAVGWVIGAGKARAEASWSQAALRWKALRKTKAFW